MVKMGARLPELLNGVIEGHPILPRVSIEYL